MLKLLRIPSRSRRSSSTALRIRTLATASTASSSSTTSSKISALPFRLSSADAIDAARTCATIAAHYDERGTLPGFGPYIVLTRFGLNNFFNLGRGFEDEVVTLEQSAAIYLPTWIVDAALSFNTTSSSSSSSTKQQARASLILENARFPGSSWAPVSSLPIWPDNPLRNGLHPAPGASVVVAPPPKLRFPGLHPGTAAPFNDVSLSEYEEWDPSSHLEHGRRAAANDGQANVTIDGPITALPFDLSPLALPSYLKSLNPASSSPSEDAADLTLSSRQVSTDAELVVLVRSLRPEILSVSEIEKMKGIDVDTTVTCNIRSAFRAFFGSSDGAGESARQQQQRAKAAASSRRQEKQRQKELEARRERKITLQPQSIEFDMLAAYPVMLPMHIIKFSYQPGGTSSSDSSSSQPPPRKTITVAVAGWDSTASHILRTLPPQCTWSRWGCPPDIVWAYDKSAAHNTEPPHARRFSPLNVSTFELLPAAPVEIPEGLDALEEALGKEAYHFFGEGSSPRGVAGQKGATLKTVRAHADALLDLGSAQSQQEEEEAARGRDDQQREKDVGKRDELVGHMLRHAYKGLMVQFFQNNLVRRASSWLNAAEADTGKAGGELGWASYRAFQQQLFEQVKAGKGSKRDLDKQQVRGVQLSPPSASTSSAKGEDTDPALSSDPTILDNTHVQPLTQAAIPNRRYLAALSDRTRTETLQALAESGDAVFLFPNGRAPTPEEEKQGRSSPGSTGQEQAPTPSFGDALKGVPADDLRLADRREGVKVAAHRLEASTRWCRSSSRSG
ncbi:hypothetical protein V8E36_009875 [Tilletia maclaganii]